MRASIAAIVPAYNEEKRLKGVLDTLVKSQFFTEIICVNDGSSDNTKAIIKQFPSVRLIDLRHNAGKANAIVKGVRAVKSDIVMLIDADLKGLNKAVFASLAEPLLGGNYDAAVGLPSKAEDITLFRPLSGERCYFRKDLLPHLSSLRDKRYGLELALNYLYRRRRVKVMRMKGVSQLHKTGKYSSRVALRRELQTWAQLAEVVAWQDNPSDFTYSAYARHFYVNDAGLRRAMIRLLRNLDRPIAVL